MMLRQKIIILKIRKPLRTTLNEELQWFGNSLGLFNLRDKDNSCFRLFIELLKAAKQRFALSSDQLAQNLNLSRGTVVHHLNKLMENGIVVHDHKRYSLREDRLESLIRNIKRDMELACTELERSAREIDVMLGR